MKIKVNNYLYHIAMKKKKVNPSFFISIYIQFYLRVKKPTIASMTATINRIIARSLEIPATPLNPKRLAKSAITAKIIAQRNMVFSLYLVVSDHLKYT